MDKLQQLENRIKELENWKSAKERQQITFPMDEKSIEVLNKYFMRLSPNGAVEYDGGAGGNPLTYYTGKQGELLFSVQKDNFTQFTANSTTDYITVINPKISFINDTAIYFLEGSDATDSLPGGITAVITTYYVINSTGNSFKISLTVGGVAVDITSNGSGVNYISYF